MKRFVLALSLALLTGYTPAKATAPTTINFLFDGTDATHDTIAFTPATQNGGTVATATDQQYTGPRSLKLSTGATPGTAQATFAGVLADSGRRISVRVRADSTPAATAQFLIIRNSSASVVFNVGLNTSRQLVATPVGLSAVTGTTVLATNAWHRITASFVFTSTSSWRVKLYIEGVQELDVNSTGTMTRVGASQLVLLNQAASGSNTNNWFDDVYVDDGDDYTDPGDIRVTSKRVFANGTSNQFGSQVGSGNSGYGTGHADEVNEQPASTTNGWATTTSGLTEEYTVEGASVGDVDISSGVTYVGSMAWIYTATVGGTPTVTMIHRGATGSVTLPLANTYSYLGGLSASYPAGNTDVGLTTTDTNTVNLWEAGLLVAYTASGAQASATPAIINNPVRGGGR